jgi:hypothetical protein
MTGLRTTLLDNNNSFSLCTLEKMHPQCDFLDAVVVAIESTIGIRL